MITLNFGISKKQKAILAFQTLSNNFDVSLTSTNSKSYSKTDSYTIYVHLDTELKRECDIHQYLEYFKNIDKFMKEQGFETLATESSVKEKISDEKSDMICLMYWI